MECLESDTCCEIQPETHNCNLDVLSASEVFLHAFAFKTWRHSFVPFPSLRSRTQSIIGLMEILTDVYVYQSFVQLASLKHLL